MCVHELQLDCKFVRRHLLALRAEVLTTFQSHPITVSPIDLTSCNRVAEFAGRSTTEDDAIRPLAINDVHHQHGLIINLRTGLQLQKARTKKSCQIHFIDVAGTNVTVKHLTDSHCPFAPTIYLPARPGIVQICTVSTEVSTCIHH